MYLLCLDLLILAIVSIRYLVGNGDFPWESLRYEQAIKEVRAYNYLHGMYGLDKCIASR